MKKLLLAVFLFAICIVKTEAQITDPFFDHVFYVGAFDQGSDWTQGWTNWDPDNTTYPATTVTVSGNITTNTTWTSSNVYLLSGFVRVKSGATLTIQPGTVIRGDKTSMGSLFIERGAYLYAVGTSSQPIVFTSNEPATTRYYGDWGGIILCGKADMNVPGDTALYEGLTDLYYGGGSSVNNNDSSANMKYVRLEFGGVALQPNKEINGITFGACGDHTRIDYIQVSYAGDDSYEWFGGNVNVKHLIAYKGLDDDFDTDFGYHGNLQFLVSLRDPNEADVSGSNGFESDNDASGSTNSPQTKPIFSNVSVYGPKATSGTTISSNYKRSMHLRRNCQTSVYNSVFAGYPTGLTIDGALTEGSYQNGGLVISHTILSGSTATKFFAIGTCLTTAQDSLNRLTAVRTKFKEVAYHNDTLADNTSLMIVDPFNQSATPNFLPQAGSPVLNRSIWFSVSTNDLSSNVMNLCNYPNPFSGKTVIRYTLSEATSVNIEVYDLFGKKVAALVNETQNDGEYGIEFDAQSFSKGMYLARITTSTGTRSLKMIIQ
ncbi:MAG: T9SS type A sorting domain-containing protein [Bacteroidota bacterium]